MGCGGSRFDRDTEVVPVRVHPLLHRRIEEIKRGRNANNGSEDSTLSSKELLYHHHNDEEEEETNNNSPPHLSDEKDECKKEGLRKKVIEQEYDDDDEKEDTFEEGEESNEEGHHTEGCIRPGSPSFRVYYVESLHNKHSDDDESKTESMITDSSHGDESISIEGQVHKVGKKGRKGGKFTRAIHKGGHVKNLWNVKLCYNPTSSSHNNNGHLVQNVAVT